MFFETSLTAERIRANREAGHWTDELLIDRFRAQAEANGDNPLVIDRLGSLTWSEAVGEVDALSSGLLDLGVRRGDVVQVQLPNRREFLLAVLAIEQIGAVVQPVAPIFRHNEVRVMSDLSRPKAVLTATEFHNFALAEMHLGLREECTWVEQVIAVPTELGGDTPADCIAWDEVLGRGRAAGFGAEAFALLRPDPNEVCEIMFTSGTTGQPKGVMHTQNTINVAADQWLARIAPDCQVFHMASTLAHQTGYLYGIRAPISAGGRVVFQEIWDPGEFAALIESEGIEASMGATPFLADLLGVANLADFDLSSFKAFVCAGAAIPLPVLEQARDRLPCTVMPGWGMTETALSTTGRRDDPFEKLATDGFPLPGNEVRVVDESGQPVPAGDEGDLQFRGPLSFVGYVQGRELTASCWRDGWFDTGDRAIMDADGYIKISGRTKDIVIRGGENVPVKEVEDVLLRHPSVVNIAVIAQPHDRLGEIGCAVIMADAEPPSLDELTAFLDEHSVTRQFWPENLIVVDEFPMTPSGKIQKFKLRQLVLE